MRIDNLEQLRELAVRIDTNLERGNGDQTFVRRQIAVREVDRLQQISDEISEVEQHLAEAGTQAVVGEQVEIILQVRITPL